MSDDRYCPTDSEVSDAIRIGKYIARSWPSISADDVVSALYEWLMVNEAYVLRYRTEGVHGRNRMRKALQNHASRWCSQEYRKTGEGLAASTEPAYTTHEIKAGLALIINQPDWGVQGENGNMNGDVLALLADVSAAYYSLSGTDREVLDLRYGGGGEYKHIADVLDVSVEIVRGRHLRALRKVKQRLMGEGCSWGRSAGLSSGTDAAVHAAVR